jgi:hypothetical protein
MYECGFVHLFYQAASRFVFSYTFWDCHRNASGHVMAVVREYEFVPGIFKQAVLGILDLYCFFQLLKKC